MANSLVRVGGCLRRSTASISRYSTASWRMVEEANIPEFDIHATLMEHVNTRNGGFIRFIIQSQQDRKKEDAHAMADLPLFGPKVPI